MKIYVNVCMRYRYSRAIQSVILVTFIIDNRVILVILFLILNYTCLYRHCSSSAVWLPRQHQVV